MLCFCKSSGRFSSSLLFLTFLKLRTERSFAINQSHQKLVSFVSTCTRTFLFTAWSLCVHDTSEWSCESAECPRSFVPCACSLYPASLAPSASSFSIQSVFSYVWAKDLWHWSRSASSLLICVHAFTMVKMVNDIRNTRATTMQIMATKLSVSMSRTLPEKEPFWEQWVQGVSPGSWSQ